jgi:superfamily I DNA/RNA helicase
MSDARLIGMQTQAAVESVNTVPAVERELFCTPQSLRILGGAGTGKTQSLTSRVQSLLGQGVLPDELLVLCATPAAAAAFRRSLQTRIGIAAEEIRITTARALALETLAQEGACTLIGRPARLLADFEVHFLLEDMKTTGKLQKRLKEMLRFFYRSWTELAEDDPKWLITMEEQQLHTLLLENLSFVQGMLEPELSKLALRYLRSDTYVLSQMQFSHVLVDDLQCQSRASQLLAHLLATKSIAVTGDRSACVEVFDSYPYLEGIDEFTIINPDATCQTLEIS